MLTEEYEDKQPKNFDVIIFDRVFPTWLPDSGNYIYFGCAPTNGKLHVQKDGAIYQTLTECSVLDWQRSHPIMRHLALGTLYAGTMYKLDVPNDAKTLVDGLKGPMVVLDREGRSTNLVVAFDLLQSNWPLKLSFPIFIHNALQYLALGSEMNVRPAYQPGATVKIPRTNLDKISTDLKSIRLFGPDGSRDVTIPTTGDFVLPAMNKVGLYKTEPPVPQFEQLAVNLLDDNESNLLPTDAPPGNVGTALAVTNGKSRLELWWWLVACGAVPLLMIEWWVYTRRVHL
jgi:Ca-activated chloride channel family protein